MIAIILAAGYGTRLYPLTINTPKALLEVGGKSILDRIVEKTEALENCTRIVIITNEKFYKNFRDWAEAGGSDIEVEVINDGTKSNETRLGAIGDINLVLEKDAPAEDILITGSDNLFEEGLAGFVQFAIKRKPFSSIALFDIKDKKLAVKYGICSLNRDSGVKDFEEKPKDPKSTLAASALYFIPQEKIKKISEYMKTDLPKDAPGNLMKWLAKVDRVYGYVLQGGWYDIGDKESLEKADREFRIKD